jgi:hypothetical protein
MHRARRRKDWYENSIPIIFPAGNVRLKLSDRHDVLHGGQQRRSAAIQLAARLEGLSVARARAFGRNVREDHWY